MVWFLRRFFKNKENSIEPVDGAIPQHVAIIMDGNGRWASHRGLPRTAGHHAGMVALRRTIRSADELGIKVLTVYAFSTENWSRPKREVDFLMRLPKEFLRTDLPELIEKNVKVVMVGSADGLPRHTREAVDEAMAATAQNTGMILNFALNYGSRAEIIHAMRDIAAKSASGLISPGDIDEQTVDNHLYTADLPDPDLLIRPSGEIRLSNFLLWQLAYAELWFTDVYWPDFDRRHLLEAIEAYQNRDRRFGGIKL
ncbi:isoprenyl transferase [Dethiobacter alkaliphilus]|uniref:isoprenyl transferase n=1 Tax=Dethiobacter alkaliphilus TaxID=427926 RepID=UPI002226DACF|nr:isoprenyl transferase [Dethiobacter alkaliphilus]MCW3490853.1 isoprenyl transferase [Dethiobacter alkaliphilus]